MKLHLYKTDKCVSLLITKVEHLVPKVEMIVLGEPPIFKRNFRCSSLPWELNPNWVPGLAV